MTDKRIVFTEDNQIRVIIPSDKALENMTIEQIALKDVPAGLSYRITDISNIPTDRTFRDAWTDAEPTETVDIDLNKARDIQMDKIRVLRNEKLKELDIETLKGVDVQAQKQILRDIPQTYDLSSAATPEELKNMIPDEVK